MLHRNDPEVESKLTLETHVVQFNCAHHAGLILKYWRQRKDNAVILAYLRLVHGVSAG